MAVEGLIVAQNFDRNGAAPRHQGFLQRYRGRGPGFGCAIAFDTTNVVLDALAQRDRDKGIQKTVPGTRRFDRIQEPIVFNDFVDVTRGVHTTIVCNRQFVPVD